MSSSASPYYTAKEAQEKLGLSKAQFHKWVRQGLVPRVVLPGMKQGVYPRRDIDALVLSMQSTWEEIIFSSSSPADQVEELDIIHKTHLRGSSFSLADRIAFQQKNRFTFHSLKVQGTIVGFISMYRLPDNLLDDLLAERKLPLEITVDQVLPFARLEPFGIYINVIAVSPDVSRHLQRLYASTIVYRSIDLLYHLLNNGYQIDTLYALAHTDAGERLLKKLGFQPMQSQSSVARRSAYQYVLDAQGLRRLHEFQERYERHLNASFQQR